MTIYTNITDDRVLLVEGAALTGSVNGIVREFRIVIWNAEGKTTAELTIDDLRALLEAAELYDEQHNS